MDLHSSMYERAVSRVLEELTERFGDSFTPAEVSAVVARGRTRLEESGKHARFVPALLDHWARDELLSMARSQGRPLSPLPKLLFVCEHNEGRSQVAAALAEHLSGGRVLVRAAGINPTGRLNPHATTVLAERGVELRNPLPHTVQQDALDAADVVVLIGCVSSDLAGRRTVRWDVADPYAQELDTARRIADELERRVRALLVELEVPLEERPRSSVDAAAAAEGQRSETRIPSGVDVNSTADRSWTTRSA